jgi:hypothetical protein
MASLRNMGSHIDQDESCFPVCINLNSILKAKLYSTTEASSKQVNKAKQQKSVKNVSTSVKTKIQHVRSGYTYCVCLRCPRTALSGTHLRDSEELRAKRDHLRYVHDRSPRQYRSSSYRGLRWLFVLVDVRIVGTHAIVWINTLINISLKFRVCHLKNDTYL